VSRAWALSFRVSRIMIIRDNRDMKYRSDKSDYEKMPLLKDCINEKIAYPIKGKALIIRHTFKV
jgi:hypothetical protein